MADSDQNDRQMRSTPPVARSEETAEAKEELRQAIHSSHEVLASANTVFPLTLFPDTVTIDREKLTITHRNFFRVGDVVSTRIEDILVVTAAVGPLFGSLRIVSRYFSPDKPYAINKLWRDDALKLKRILQGYVIARQREIDVNPLTTKELADMLDELGEDTHA